MDRVGLFELLILDEEINDLVHQNNFTANTIRRAYQPKGMITFQDDARQKILQNITTPEEVLRILG
jgi:type II secretory ATPase GspE/PulE/Tfp pilus assembly ATPase PilB-like protein